MLTDLIPFFKKYDYKFDGKLAYGYFKERIVSFVENSSTIKATMSFTIPLTKEQAYQISMKIKDLKNKYRPLMQGLVTNINLELVLYQGSDLLENVEMILDDVTNIVNEQSISALGVCPLCGKSLPTDSPFMRIKDSVIQAHNECLNNLEAESNRFNEANNKNANNSLKKPIIIASAITILIVLLNVLLGFVGAYPYLVALSGWLNFYVISVIFHKLRVPLFRKQLVVLEVFAAICVLLSVWLGSYTYIYLALVEKPQSIMVIIQNYFAILINNPDLGKIILYSLIFGFVMILIPFFNIYRRVQTGYSNTMKRL